MRDKAVCLGGPKDGEPEESKSFTEDRKRLNMKSFYMKDKNFVKAITLSENRLIPIKKSGTIGNKSSAAARAD